MNTLWSDMNTVPTSRPVLLLGHTCKHALPVPLVGRYDKPNEVWRDTAGYVIHATGWRELP